MFIRLVKKRFSCGSLLSKKCFGQHLNASDGWRINLIVEAKIRRCRLETRY